jgi:hypothetical protein
MAATIYDYVEHLKKLIQEVQAGNFRIAVQIWDKYPSELQFLKDAERQAKAELVDPKTDGKKIQQIDEDWDWYPNAFDRLNELHCQAALLLAKKAEELGLDSTPFYASDDLSQRVADSKVLLQRMLVILGNKTKQSVHSDATPPSGNESKPTTLTAAPLLDADDYSLPDTPTRWGKRFGFSARTFVRRAKDGKITVKKLSDRSYRVLKSEIPFNNDDKKVDRSGQSGQK